MPRPLLSTLKIPGRIAWKTLEEFLADQCPQMAAATSFYMLFSLPPLLVLLIMLLEPFLDPGAAMRLVEREVGAFIGPQAAAQVAALLENVSRPGQGGPLAAILGLGAFLFGATAAFSQLQGALNAAWGVAPDPQRHDLLNFILKRALSFVMIAGIGVVLVLSLLLSAALAAFEDALEVALPALPSAPLLRVFDGTLSFGIAALLFTVMYRYLPDARVSSRAALLGGVVTAIFFTGGTLAIGFYLGRADPGSAFGAAGSLALVLIWIYYSAMMLLLGAEFTQVWMRHRGDPIEPVPGAARLIRRKERFEPGVPDPKSEAVE